MNHFINNYLPLFSREVERGSFSQTVYSKNQQKSLKPIVLRSEKLCWNQIILSDLSTTPWKINMEPANQTFRKENDLNQTSRGLCSMLIFQRANQQNQKKMSRWASATALSLAWRPFAPCFCWDVCVSSSRNACSRSACEVSPLPRAWWILGGCGSGSQQ